MKLDKETIESMLISQGIKNLNEFGYPDVTKENILSDLIYREFFKRMLENALDGAKESVKITEVITELLKKIKENETV